MNRRTLTKGLLASASIVGLSRESPAQESDRRDGNWWMTLLHSDQVTLIVGFVDGMDLGYKFSLWGMKKADAGLQGKVVESYDQMANRYLTNVTAGQLADGISEFYKDYRNRSILFSGAAWLVLQGIAGMSQPDLDRAIESWRKNASKQ